MYNSLIGSVLQCADCVWQIGNKENLDKLNTVQRKGWSLILGLIPLTVSLEAMEVMSGVIPLDFRREEIAIRHLKKITHILQIPIKNQLDKWRRKETTDSHISPLGLMCLQGKETKIDVKNIEEEFQFHGLQASTTRILEKFGIIKN